MRPVTDFSRTKLSLVWAAFVFCIISQAVSGFADFFNIGIYALLLTWLHWNRCLGLLGALFLGALVVSSGFDILGVLVEFDAGKSGWPRVLEWFSAFFSFLLASFILITNRVEIASRWVVLGVVLMFLGRFYWAIMGPQSVFETKMNRQVHSWVAEVVHLLNRFGLRGQFPLRPIQSESIPILNQMEMPCGIMNFVYEQETGVSDSAKTQLHVKECGFHPQAFVVRNLMALEIHNALPRAVEFSLSSQNEKGEFSQPRTVVVAPNSFVELVDLRVPEKGALLIYAPLETKLGVSVILSEASEGRWRVGRDPLILERQKTGVR